MQISLFTAKSRPIQLELPGADVVLYDGFYSPDIAQSLFDAILAETSLATKDITLFGKKMLQPRLLAWVGNEGIAISYSGTIMRPQPWGIALSKIKADMEMLTGLNFNGVLVNYYRDGKDSMGWHSDDEPENGPNPCIPSVSFGATRKFQFRSKADKAIPTLSVPLNHGSVLIMAGQTQSLYKHQIPKTALPTGPRLNLTFRRIIK